LGERLNGIQEVRGSTPLGSTTTNLPIPPSSRLLLPDRPGRIEGGETKPSLKYFLLTSQARPSRLQCPYADTEGVFDLRNNFFNVIKSKTRVEPPATERLVDGDNPTRPIAINLINHTRRDLTAEGRRLATLSPYRITETTLLEATVARPYHHRGSRRVMPPI
jgi:hypothetical protein